MPSIDTINNGTVQFTDVPPVASSHFKPEPLPQSTAKLAEKKVKTVDTLLNEHREGIKKEAARDKKIGQLLGVITIVLVVAYITTLFVAPPALFLLFLIPYVFAYITVFGALTKYDDSEYGEVRANFVDGIQRDSNYSKIKDLAVTANPEMEPLLNTISELQSVETLMTKNHSNKQGLQLRKVTLEKEFTKMIKGAA